MYSPAFVSGFKELGHIVGCFDTESYKQAKTAIEKISRKLSFTYHIGLRILKINRDLISKIENDRPDVVFFYKCYEFYPSTYKRIKALGITCVSYNNDDPFSNVLRKTWDDWFLKSLRYCDINYVYRKKNILDYKKMGINNAKVLLPYFLKGQNRFVKTDKDIPVGFIGHYENDGRDLIVKYLLDNNIPIQIFGKEHWKSSFIYDEICQCIKTSKMGDEYNYTINRFQIALVFLSKLNHDTYTRRCFEIPATKTLMLCEYSDDMNSLFPENECAVYFRSKEDLAEKIKYLLCNPGEIDRIAKNGFERLKVIGGSEVDRCSEIISDVTVLNSI